MPREIHACSGYIPECQIDVRVDGDIDSEKACRHCAQCPGLGKPVDSMRRLWRARLAATARGKVNTMNQ